LLEGLPDATSQMDADPITKRTGTGSRPAFLAVACAGTLAFLAISFAPQVSVEKYRWSFASLIPILWAVYALRVRLAVEPLHYALFALALVLHDLGAFGWYSRHVAGLQFDWCVHFFFGGVGALMFARWLHVRVGLRGRVLFVLAVLGVGGIGALHEIFEAATTMFLGDHGMAYYGPDNPFDAQEDMLAATVGAVLCAAIAVVSPGRGGGSRRS
jgi:uncharacterized membrane protein YjdF